MLDFLEYLRSAPVDKLRPHCRKQGWEVSGGESGFMPWIQQMSPDWTRSLLEMSW